MTDRYVDFDAAFSEEDATPLRIKLFGKEWELPATMPAAAVLRVVRWQADGRDVEQELSKSELIALAGDLVPQDVLTAWQAKGLDIDQLGHIVGWQMRQYQGLLEDGEGPGEAGAPHGAPSSSSNGGDFSKPTSPASTGSS